MKKKLLLMATLIAVLVFTFALTAFAVNIDGIDYSFNETDATVTTGNQSCALTEVNIPSTVTYEGTTYNVTAIANKAFNGSSITSITIPSSVVSVGNEAFRTCKALTTVVFEGADTTIGTHLFFFCGANLTSVTLPTNLVTIPSNTFFGCTSSSFRITNADSLTKLTTIGASAFQDTNNLTFTIPDSVTTIEASAFQSACSKSGSITINPTSKLVTIGNSAFHDCKKLPSIYIPSTVTSIGTKAFISCNALSEVANFENCQITTIENGTFQYAWAIKTLKIPETVTTIGTAFADNNALTLVYIPKSVTSIADTFTGGKPTNAVFVYTGKDASVLSTCSKIAGANVIQASNYDETASYKGINLVVGYSHCVAYYNGVHAETTKTVDVTSFLEEICVNQTCTKCQCALETEKIGPIYTCFGYSVSETDTKGVAVRYTVDFEALEEYEKAAGTELNYGLFVLANSEIGTTDILNEEGNAVSGAVAAEFSGTGFFSFEIKVVGLEKYPTTEFALGAYVVETIDTEKKFSYLQLGEPEENAKYYFASYEDILEVL